MTDEDMPIFARFFYVLGWIFGVVPLIIGVVIFLGYTGFYCNTIQVLVLDIPKEVAIDNNPTYQFLSMLGMLLMVIGVILLAIFFGITDLSGGDINTGKKKRIILYDSPTHRIEYTTYYDSKAKEIGYSETKIEE